MTTAVRDAAEKERLSQLSKRLRHYVLRDKLGSGGYGSVFLAECVLQGRPTWLAVKVIRRSRVARGPTTEMLCMEVASLQLLAERRSLFFPQLFEAFSDAHNLYIVTDYLQGGTLRDEMDRGPMKAGRVKFIMAQLTVSLSELRDVYTVHRDLKPENIMLDKIGNITVIDFGLCRKFETTVHQQELVALYGYGGGEDDDLVTRKHCGTMAYSAPEVIRRKYYSFEVDIYAVGVIFYEMLFCDRPFRAKYLEILAWMIVETDWRVPDGVEVDDDVLDLLRKLLHKKPDQRPSIEELKAHPFFSGVDWDMVASRSYVLPDEYAPASTVKPNKRVTVDPLLLIDKKAPPPGCPLSDFPVRRRLDKAFKVRPTRASIPTARPENPRRLSSKIKRAVSDFKYRLAPSSSSIPKLWFSPDKVYVRRVEDVGIVPGSVQDAAGVGATGLGGASAAGAIPVHKTADRGARDAPISIVNSSMQAAGPCATSDTEGGRRLSTLRRIVNRIPERRPSGQSRFKIIKASDLTGFRIALPPKASRFLPPSLAGSTLTAPSSAGPSTPTRGSLQVPTTASKMGPAIKPIVTYANSLAIPRALGA